MKTLVYYYSNSGNNAYIAMKVAERLGADLEQVHFPHKDMGGAAMTAILPFMPKIRTAAVDLGNYDHVVFISPIWMGKLAKPMQALMRKERQSLGNFSVLSFAGGALGDNDGFKAHVSKLTRSNPQVCDQILINSILPDEKQGKMEETSGFSLDDESYPHIEERVEAFCERIPA